MEFSLKAFDKKRSGGNEYFLVFKLSACRAEVRDRIWDAIEKAIPDPPAKQNAIGFSGGDDD